MKISEVIAELVQNDATERPVYVTLFERDSDGCVISKKKYPVSAVFSYRDDEAHICIEHSQEGK